MGQGGSPSIHAIKQHNSGWYPDDHFLAPVFTFNVVWHSYRQTTLYHHNIYLCQRLGYCDHDMLHLVKCLTMQMINSSVVSRTIKPIHCSLTHRINPAPSTIYKQHHTIKNLSLEPLDSTADFIECCTGIVIELANMWISFIFHTSVLYYSVHFCVNRLLTLC